jgi:hypothetical protein
MKPLINNPVRFIEKHGRTLKLHECRLNINSALASVLVTRVVPNNGGYISAFYLIDIYCLGLKSTGGKHFETKAAYEMFVDTMSSNLGGDISPCDPMYAYNIIWGGIEYAEDNGIDILDKDFKYTQFLIPPADKIDYVEFEFGQNGKPFYMRGPYDNAPLIMSKLIAKLGAGNFHYVTEIRPEDN